MLFYRRRTEGRPVRRNILDRSLSQSFAEEHKKLKEKYAALDEEEEGENSKKTDEIDRDNKRELNTKVGTRNEV